MNKTRYAHLTDLADAARICAIRCESGLSESGLAPTNVLSIAQRAEQERDALTVEEAASDGLEHLQAEIDRLRA